MDIFAPIARSIVAPAWARWERSPYLQHYRRLQRTQYDAPETIFSRQWEALDALIRHACETSPFWQSRLRKAGVEPNRPLSPEQFCKIPVLSRNDIQVHRHKMRSDIYRGVAVQRRKTSGSTGEAVEIVLDEEAAQFKRGCTLRTDEWSGWRFGERAAVLWGDPEHLKHGWRGRLRNQLLERRTCLDTLHMNDADIARFAAELCRRPPSLLMGHAHSIYLFAQFLRVHGVSDIHPRGVISTAMVLHDWERQTIEEVFQAPVTNRYGCEEVSLIACECEQHAGLHINADGVYLEIVRPDGSPARPGEVGMVVVTDLQNRAMPILRYQIGDTAVLADRQCPCGRGLPLLEAVTGRIADYVVTRSGMWISGISLTDHFGGMVPGVAQLQIVQESVDDFVFRLVRGPGFGPKSLETIGQLVAERFGGGVHYECEYVDHIPQEPSGKYRFCISKVAGRYRETMQIESR